MNEPLPPDLRELQDQLARRRLPEPSVGLRARLLDQMKDMAGPTAPKAGRWRLVWRLAAAVIVALNVGLSIDNGVRFQRLTPQEIHVGSAHEAANVAEENGRFQQFARRAVANVAPAPDAGALSRLLFSEEERGWVMP
jgi:hypothetical protein